MSKACLSNERQSDIPDCFIRWKESFLIYGEYCSKLPAAQDRVDEVVKKTPEYLQAIQVSTTTTDIWRLLLLVLQLNFYVMHTTYGLRR